MFSKIYRNMELHLQYANDPDVRARATFSFRLMLQSEQMLKLMVSLQVKCPGLE